MVVQGRYHIRWMAAQMQVKPVGIPRGVVEGLVAGEVECTVAHWGPVSLARRFLVVQTPPMASERSAGGGVEVQAALGETSVQLELVFNAQLDIIENNNLEPIN